MDHKNNYCTFYIVRHGQTQWNVKEVIQGQLDSPLTDKGKLQAKKLHEELKHIRFDAIFSSDLLRAKHTSEIIALERKLAVETTKMLRERQYGRLEGKSRDMLKELETALSHLQTQQRFSHKSFPEIESDEEVAGRFITFLRETAIVYPNKTVLVVTHGGMMRALLVHLGYITYKLGVFLWDTFEESAGG